MMPKFSRRALLGTGAAAMAAPAAVSSATVAGDQDAELIAVCAEFIACERAQCAIYDGPDAIEGDDEAAAAATPLFARTNALLDSMAQLHATTPAGIQARAQALAQHSGHWGFSFDDPTTCAGRLLDYLMRDAAALGSGEVRAYVPPPSPDADLIALCAQLDASEREWLQVLRTGDEEASDLAREKAVAKQKPIVDRICELQPATMEGARALAASILVWTSGDFASDDYTDGRLASILVRGLAGEVEHV